jgi:benzoylformate decarboxylase
MGFLSAAMGGLGFALPGTIGVRMALPDRPVVAVLGDGSSLYAIQALWSAARYRVGALLLVMANGGYAIMDKLAADTGKPAPWPGFGTIDIAAMARAQGCEAVRIEDHADLVARLVEALAQLGRRDAPLLLEIAVAP